MNIEVAVSQILFIEQQVESNIKGLTLEDRLAFTEAVSVNLHSRQLSSFLLLRELATTKKTVALLAHNTVTCVQVAIPRGYYLTIQQQLFIWDAGVAEEQWPKVEQLIDLEQTIEVDVAKAAYQPLLLTDAIGLSITKNLIIETTFTPVEGVIGYLPDKYWSSYEIEVIVP